MKRSTGKLRDRELRYYIKLAMLDADTASARHFKPADRSNLSAASGVATSALLIVIETLKDIWQDCHSKPVIR